MREPSPITFGERPRVLQIGGFVVSETRHRAGMRLRPHDHEVANINVPLRGRFLETVERQRLDCAPGTLLIKPAGARHSNVYGGEAVNLLIEIPAGVQQQLDLGALVREPRLVRDRSPFAARIARELRAGDDAATRLVIEGLLYELLGGLLRGLDASARRPAWLAEVERLAAESASVAAIARAVGRHPSHVAREFRRHVGTSIGDFARRRRLEAAAARLRDGDEPIAEVALAAGFHDQSHFTNRFRQLYATTPARFRRDARTQRACNAAPGVQDA